MEIYRVEITDQHQIHKELHIPQARLRRTNRCYAAGQYFKHRLQPYLFSHLTFNRIMKKKTDASYLKALEKRLLESEKENQFFRFKAEAFEIAIQIAEKDWAASAV
ncbi:hypothetical protein [Dyadobacter sandarakinus]|uniref:Uncharacterized protein n=1 Tax=Dyadobacter sandarakinus TaxID=2747268 RepID=A0ABX7I450_9BACT|nr:hypothetical protein [Dyadobacter sandarakinus]QRR00849.1 hypothetical protein HWI92_07970 [Dyadobacter sandarakinus]